MVGHTHCDVDQLFSIYAKVLKRHSWNGTEELVSLIRGSYRGNAPTIVRDMHKYEWKSWMEPHLCDLAGHQKVYYIEFKRNADGRIGFMYSGKCQ
jgi:hypothetical protein